MKKAMNDLKYWIKAKEDEWYGEQGQCPVCNHVTIDVDNFCPHCGQRLEIRKDFDNDNENDNEWAINTLQNMIKNAKALCLDDDEIKIIQKKIEVLMKD